MYLYKLNAKSWNAQVSKSSLIWNLVIFTLLRSRRALSWKAAVSMTKGFFIDFKSFITGCHSARNVTFQWGNWSFNGGICDGFYNHHYLYITFFFSFLGNRLGLDNLRIFQKVYVGFSPPTFELEETIHLAHQFKSSAFNRYSTLRKTAKFLPHTANLLPPTCATSSKRWPLVTHQRRTFLCRRRLYSYMKVIRTKRVYPAYLHTPLTHLH